MRQGPLSGLKVIEFAGIGPAPFCGQLFADQGADVVRIDRKGLPQDWVRGVTARGRRSVALDLKVPASIEACLALMEKADVVIEGYRPGVMERLGLGPEPALMRNPRLVYGRMTGWGQTGPLARTAGHDINYIAITGALSAIGAEDKPIPPLNLVGDFGGGALYLAFGVLAAVVSARESGQGQVVDCAMVDGAASLMAMFYHLLATGRWQEGRRGNMFDGGAPYYDTYRCADGGWVAVGALEAQFYAELLGRMGLDGPEFHPQNDRAQWESRRGRIAARFAERTRDQWCDIMQGADACFAPVLGMAEAPDHPHNRARGVFVEVEGVVQPAPAPRFSLTPGAVQGPSPRLGQHDREALADWGFSEAEVEALRTAGAIA